MTNKNPNKNKNNFIANKKSHKLQSAIDFMVSYGISLLFLSIVIYALYAEGVFNLNLVSPNCIATQSFKCVAYMLKANGTVYIMLQSFYPGSIIINGVGCSSQVNSTGNAPKYGNVHLLSPVSANGKQYYPANSNTIIAFGGQNVLIKAYCYNNPSGIPSQNKLGTPFNGYVWLNFTYSSLPNNVNNIIQVFSFTTKTE